MRGKKLILVTILLALVGCVAGGAWLMRRGFSARDNPSALEVLVAGTVRRLSVPEAARRAKNPFAATPEVLAEARAHFADHCALCHGNDGSGNTRVGRNLYPRPPDMRLPATQSLTDGELYYVIHNGVRLTGMPAWGEPHKKDDDSWKLVVLIRHLPQLTPEERREMERWNPKSAAEQGEEEEERRFLNESESPKAKGKQPH